MPNLNLNSTGYDLYEVSNNEWVIDAKNGEAYHGTLKEIFFYMCNNIGFHSNEVLDALEFLDTERETNPQINAIHFGAFKKFIFTFEKKLDLLARAS